jgi:hypothetical protein
MATYQEQVLEEYVSLLKQITALDGEAEQRRNETLAPIGEEILSLTQQIEMLKAYYAVDLDALSEEINARRSVLTEQADAQKKAVEDAVLSMEKPQTVKVAEMMAVYTPPSLNWNKKKLEGYGAAHPDVYGCAEEVEAKVVIRRR